MRRSRETLLTEWDNIRRYIADGCTHSGPRDWFESVIDAKSNRIAELEDALRRVVRDVNDYEADNRLSPNPGRSVRIASSMANAKRVLGTQ